MTNDEAVEIAAVWSGGDYPSLADLLAPVADRLVAALDEAVGGLAGTHVVDVAAGTGSVALAAAGRGARVTATDITPVLVDAGRVRTAGQEVVWHVADARALPVPDGTADVVASSVGLIFVPDPAALVAEVARVLRPGGTLGFTAWEPRGPDDPIAGPLSRRLPKQPAGAPQSDDWGREDIARERLGDLFDDVRVTRAVHEWRFPSASEMTDFLLLRSPMHVAGLAAVPAADRAATRDDYVTGISRSADATGAVTVPMSYLSVTAVRR